ncbi:hypothetical protein GCM10008943_24300 [Paenochrobactrum glaciei]|uniref:Transposase n=1 Tax=Paenochrobactrum glaciei TaxID=486407 RepID=A0ABP3RCI1_9HYPH
MIKPTFNQADCLRFPAFDNGIRQDNSRKAKGGYRSPAIAVAVYECLPAKTTGL